MVSIELNDPNDASLSAQVEQSLVRVDPSCPISREAFFCDISISVLDGLMTYPKDDGTSYLLDGTSRRRKLLTYEVVAVSSDDREVDAWIKMEAPSKVDAVRKIQR